MTRMGELRYPILEYLGKVNPVVGNNALPDHTIAIFGFLLLYVLLLKIYYFARRILLSTFRRYLNDVHVRCTYVVAVYLTVDNNIILQ